MARFRGGRRRGGLALVVSDADLRRAFLALEESVQGEHAMSAVEAGGDVLLGEMQARAPKGATGDLAASLESRSKKGRKDSVEVEVGAHDAARSGRYYAPFVELGHKKKSKAGPVHVPAQPFMRPALKSAHSRIIEAMSRQLTEGIARVTRGAR